MKRRYFLLSVFAASLSSFSVAQPVTSHPRIWISGADVIRLRSWADAGNPLYAQGIQPALAAAVTT